MFTIYLLTISVILTMVLMPVFIKLAPGLGMLDIPDKRKIHKKPVPRIGGLVLALGASVPFFWWAGFSRLTVSILAGFLVILIVGVIDDSRGMRARQKFAAQIIAASIVVIIGGIKVTSIGAIMGKGDVCLGFLSIPFSIFLITGITNAINLADGLDGLAAGLCLLIFGCIGFLALRANNIFVMVFSIVIIGAIFGFLRYNSHPAVVFLGDTGSQFLGFSAGILTILLTQGNSIYSPVLPLIILGFPMIDIMLVMFERFMEKTPLFAADNRHFHHKLLYMGFKHEEAVIVIYTIQLVFMITAYLSKFLSDAVLFWSYMTTIFLFILFSYYSHKSGIRFHRPDGKNIFLYHRLSDALRRTNLANIAFNIMAILISAYFIIMPFFIGRLSSDIWLLSLILLIVIIVSTVLKRNISYYLLRVSAYFIGIYLLYTTSIHGGNFIIYYALLGVLFMAYLIGTNEHVPVGTLDYLVLIVLFIVPNVLKAHVYARQSILLSVEFAILFMSMELFFYKLRDKSLISYSGPIAALAVMTAKGFL